MAKTLAGEHTEKLFAEAPAKSLLPNIVARAVRKFDMLDAAISLDDLSVPPGDRSHALQGDSLGKRAISINDQWRICFRFDGERAYDVEICDYH